MCDSVDCPVYFERQKRAQEGEVTQQHLAGLRAVLLDSAAW